MSHNDDIVGKLVLARVTRVEAYGIYLRFDGDKEVLVLIPDVSYEPIPDLMARFSAGDEIQVRLLYYVEDDNRFKGTIKDA